MSPMPHTHYLHHLHGTRPSSNAPRHFYSPLPAIDLPRRDGHFLPPAPAVGTMTHSTTPHVPVIMPPTHLLPSPTPSETPFLEPNHNGIYPPLHTPSTASSPSFLNAVGNGPLTLFIAAFVVLSALGAVLWWMSWLMKRKDGRVMLEEEEEEGEGREGKKGWMREMMRRCVGRKKVERREEEGLLWLE